MRTNPLLGPPLRWPHHVVPVAGGPLYTPVDRVLPNDAAPTGAACPTCATVHPYAEHCHDPGGHGGQPCERCTRDARAPIVDVGALRKERDRLLALVRDLYGAATGEIGPGDPKWSAVLARAEAELA